MARKIQFRRGTAASWTSTNPTLAIGELGLETDTGKMKIGDGTTAWTSRPYIDAAAVAHIAASAGAHAASAIANTPAGGIAATTVQAALNELDTEKAPLASPALTGTPTAPTAATSTSTTQVATTAFVQQERAAQAATDSSRLLSATPGAVGQVATVTDDDPYTIGWEDVTLAGTLPVANGGTGATSAAAARANLGVVSMIVKRKATIESVTASTTLQDDNDFFFSLAANEIATVEIVIFPEAGDVSADMKINFTVPSGATARYATFSTRGSDDLMQATSSHSAVVAQINAGGAGSQSYPVRVMASVVNGATAGTVQFQWAQSAAAGTTSIVPGSYMIVHKTT